MAAIVPFEDRHVEGIVALCAAEGRPSWTRGAVAAAFSAPGVIGLVAEEGERVVGAAELLTDGVVIAYLGVLVVASDVRGNGIGGSLVDELFRRSGLQRIDLLSEEASAGFYESRAHKAKPGYRVYRSER